MLVDIYENSGGHSAIIKCDHCGAQSRKSFKLVKGRNFHFCNRKCSSLARRPGGALHAVNSRAWEIGRRGLREKHGVDNPMKIPAVVAKFVGRTKNPECIERTRQTLLQRYGVTCPYQIERVRERARSSEAQAKRLNSWKKTCYERISMPERMLREALERVVGRHDVDIQVIINDRWPIDLYVKSVDTYVQVDGVYWHGLDRPMDEIAASTSPRDRTIARKWATDREQDAWFEREGRRLVRVTDVQVRSDLSRVVDTILTVHDHHQ